MHVVTERRDQPNLLLSSVDSWSSQDKFILTGFLHPGEHRHIMIQLGGELGAGLQISDRVVGKLL